MKTKYYWKVVETGSNGVFKSFIVCSGRHCLTYQVGKITKTSVPETGVLVFKTRYQARAFRKQAGSSYSSTILKVIPIGPKIEVPAYYDPFDLEYDVKTSGTPAFPEGTVAFDSVKVVGE
jgi:hypothetical protein